jgi:hypothetical protein
MASGTGNQRDVLGGVVCIATGIGAVAEASRYTLGTLAQLGPGFYPAILGALLAGVGMMIAGSALLRRTQPEVPDPLHDPGPPEWRGWGCIIGGVVLFIVCAWSLGLVAATFACVFVSALGDRTNTVRRSLLLAVAVTGGGALLFRYFLGVSLPLWQWGPT